MASLSRTFAADTHRVHGEHETLIDDLSHLDRALDRLDCYSEVFANLAGADEVHFYSRKLIEQLPGHFDREEATVLEPVARVSPPLEVLVRELKKEHESLRSGLVAFSIALEELDAADDLYEAISQVKELGKDLVCEISRHVALEEQELAGFL
jgi:hemerythrin-like domain-containing protein